MAGIRKPQSAAAARPIPWGKLVKWGLLLALAFALVATVVEVGVAHVLAHFVHAHGFLYVVAMVALCVLTFVINYLIALIGEAVLIGGGFVVLVAVMFFVDLAKDSQPKAATNATQPEDAAPPVQ